jgi:GNAT superfamily N-acetyltransferase
MAIEIVSFEDNHVGDAASLVAARYRAERDLEKSLPARFEDPDAILPLLQKYAKSRTGMAVIREGKLAGFLMPLFILLRGVRTVYVPDWGHAGDSDGKCEIYREMYAGLARRWIANGYFVHAVTVLAHEREVLDAWFSLGFGLTTIDALRSLSPVMGPSVELEIRRATSQDIDSVMLLKVGLWRHMAASPAFMPMVFFRERESTERQLSDSAEATWLAYRNEWVIGHMSLGPVKPPDAVMPTSGEHIVAIRSAFVKEEDRSRGVGTALLNHSFTWAKSVGYTHCSVDYESFNISGTRFWQSRGFKPVCYSLIRHIDERIAWAHEGRDEADLLRGL